MLKFFGPHAAKNVLKLVQATKSQQNVENLDVNSSILHVSLHNPKQKYTPSTNQAGIGLKQDGTS